MSSSVNQRNSASVTDSTEPWFQVHQSEMNIQPKLYEQLLALQKNLIQHVKNRPISNDEDEIPTDDVETSPDDVKSTAVSAAVATDMITCLLKVRNFPRFLKKYVYKRLSRLRLFVEFLLLILFLPFWCYFYPGHRFNIERFYKFGLC